MTPADPTQSEVEAIVARLTEAQREVILRCGSARRRAIDFHGHVAEKLRCATGKRPALVNRYIARDHGRRVAWYFLTAQGLAVRTHLRRAAALSGLAALDAETMDKEIRHD